MAVMKVEVQIDTATGQASLGKLAGGLDDTGKRAKATQSILQGVGQGFGQKLFDGMVGVVGWLGKGAMAAIKWADSIGVTAAKMQTSAESAQKLTHIGLQTDTSIGAITAGVDKMNKALTGSPEAFTRLGLSTDTLRKAKPEEQLALIADKLNGIEDQADRAEAARAIFGKGWQEMAPLLEAGGDAIRELAAESDRLGLNMSEGAIAAGREMDDTMTKLGEVMDGLWRNVGAGIVTSEPLHRLLEGLVEILGSFSKGVQDGESDMRSFVDGGVILVANGLSLLVKGIGYAIDMWTAFQLGILAVAAAAEIQVTWMIALGNAMLHPTKASEILKKAQADTIDVMSRAKASMAAEIATNTERQNKMAAVQVAVDKLAQSVKDADGVTHKATATQKTHNLTLGEKAAALKKAQAEQEKTIALMKKNAEELHKLQFVTGKLAESEAQRMRAEIDRTGVAAKLTAEVLARAKAEEAVAAAGEAGKAAAERYIDEVEKAIAANQAWVATIHGVADGLFDLGDAIGGTLGTVVSMGATGVSVFATINDVVVRGRSNTEKMAGALGGAAAAYKSGSVAAGAMNGAMAGAQWGPWGAAIGAVAGGILGFIGKAARLREEMAKMRSEFVQSMGGMDKLKASAERAGVSLDAMFKAKTAKELEAAIARIKKELDTTAEAQEALTDAAKRYGFTLAELGPALQRQELDKQAAQLYKDFEILKAGLVPIPAILERMGPAASQFVQQSLRMGTDIPRAMQPMLIEMARAGKLLKENGDAYTEAEVNGFSYADTMSKMFADLIKKVDELVSALLRIPSNITTTHTINQSVNGSGGGGHEEPGGAGGRPGRPGRDRDGDPETPFASGTHGNLLLFKHRPGGHRIRVAENGEDEALMVVRGSDMQKAANGSGGAPQGSGSGDIHLTIPIYVAGRKVDQVLVARNRAGLLTLKQDVG